MQNKKVVESYKRNWVSFFQELTDYKDIHLMMYPQEYRLAERFEDLGNDVAMDSKQVSDYYLDETVRILEGRLGKVTKNDFVLGVKLKTESVKVDADLKENILSMFSTATDTIINLLGWEQDVSTSFFKQYEEAEDSIASIVSSVNGVRLMEDELIYINRYNFLRGLEHQVGEEIENSSVDSITNTLIDPTLPSVLKINSDQDEGYISFVVVDEFPNNMAESELFYEAQSLPFPVEVEMKVQAENKSKTKMDLNLKHQQLKESSNEQHKVGDRADSSVSASQYMIRHLQDDIKKDDVNMMNWLSVIIVNGKSKKECMYRAKLVTRHMKQIGVTCRIPLADQLQLFYKFLPGEKLDVTNRNWLQKTTQDGLAEGLFGVNADVGSRVGFFIGWIDRFNKHQDLESAIASSRYPVLFHPFLANQQVRGSKTRSPHVLISGDTGNGKSYLAKLLFIYISMLNVKCLYIDPKKELRKWVEKVMNDRIINRDYPLYIEHLKKFHFITLDAEDKNNWGALDPIVFLPPMQAKEMVQVVFSQVYDFRGKDDIHTAFLRAVTTVLEQREKGQQVGSMNIIEILQDHEESSVKKAGDFLYEVVSDSILKLCVHDGSQKSLSLDERISIIEIENLDLPEVKDSIESYTNSQLKSSAVMFALGKFCELFGSLDKTERTAEFLDEAWVITSSQQGRKVEKQMRRVGRSYNNALFFISQSTKDAIREEESGNFGVAFAFDEPTERKDVLKWMNLEPSQENEEMLEGMFQGQCLMKDYYGRTSKISIDCLFDEWYGALETIERSNVAYAEEKYL
ncbi:ATP-binding protein [Virgibacillus sp. AGTR]|uniref:ATP-binding protein n=1 Tax=Virgibacillus sp. AGTR TaxID=2812055 RepID=UPI00272A4787|nr:ATP-binding protein [Virgibacillus sp. AGTR]